MLYGTQGMGRQVHFTWFFSSETGILQILKLGSLQQIILCKKCVQFIYTRGNFSTCTIADDTGLLEIIILALASNKCSQEHQMQVPA